MSVAFPRIDILTLVGFEPPFTFQPVSRQDVSQLANGGSIATDFGSAIWVGSFTTTELQNDDMVDYQAVLATLDGVINSFEAYDLRRPCPKLYRDGSAANGFLNSVNANKKALTLSSLNAGQTISRGDYLSFDYGGNRALHQAVETVSANGGGLTPEFEVRPHLRPGFTTGSTAVNLKAPRGLFNMVPKSVLPQQTRGTFGKVSFQIAQVLS